MSQMTIFYFEDSVLRATEELQSANVVEAMQRASTQHPELRAEVWSSEGKLAIVRPTTTRRSR